MLIQSQHYDTTIIHTIQVLLDNYVFIIASTIHNKAILIDPATSTEILDVIKSLDLNITHILNTHHHHDHIGGNFCIQQSTQCQIVGYIGDQHRIDLDIKANDGDLLEINDIKFQILFCPGHTSGHIVYFLPQYHILFCGDTIFPMGCGRLFEGTAEQMLHSINKIKQLPQDSVLYCAHEYAENNGKFALSVEPRNNILQQHMQDIKRLRLNNLPTVPTILSQELLSNPFMRTSSNEIKSSLGLNSSSTDLETFTKLRQYKDNF